MRRSQGRRPGQCPPAVEIGAAPQPGTVAEPLPQCLKCDRGGGARGIADRMRAMALPLREAHPDAAFGRFPVDTNFINL